MHSPVPTILTRTVLILPLEYRFRATGAPMFHPRHIASLLGTWYKIQDLIFPCCRAPSHRSFNRLQKEKGERYRCHGFLVSQSALSSLLASDLARSVSSLFFKNLFDQSFHVPDASPHTLILDDLAANTGYLHTQMPVVSPQKQIEVRFRPLY